MSRSVAASSTRWSTQVIERSSHVREVGLRLVGPVRQKAGRAPFVVVLLAVFGLGLGGLIVMSTLMQSQAFAISELRQQTAALEAERDGLASAVESLQSPSSIADRALSEGMVPNTNPVFLRLSDGRVIGKPVPAEPGTNVRRAD